MYEIDNNTSWAAGAYPGWRKDKEFQYTLVVKQTFIFDAEGKLEPAVSSTPIQVVDEYHGDPQTTGIKIVNDIAPFKKGGEVLLLGTVYPHKIGASVTEAKITINGENINWSKSITVFGKRKWTKVRGKYKPSKPEVLGTLELDYQNSFGGWDEEIDDDQESLNPIGTGFIPKVQKGGLFSTNAVVAGNPEGIELPQIELTKELIREPEDNPSPAGFGPIPPFWMPRAELSKDIDEEAAIAGCCHYKDNVAEEIYNCAPIDQQFDSSFKGNLIISLQNMTKGKSNNYSLNLKVFLQAPELWSKEKDIETELNPVCDTMLIDMDKSELSLVWRAGVEKQMEDDVPGWLYVIDSKNSEDEALAS